MTNVMLSLTAAALVRFGASWNDDTMRLPSPSALRDAYEERR